ncbi:MAG: DUF4976 domain-containing protein [Planctomycetes bacterium]|nr:DUF4976 domain-containing protein [Planctomycetota bacterium]
MNRRTFLRSAGAGVVMLLSGSSGTASSLTKTTFGADKTKRKPNILFLFSDDQTFRAIHIMKELDVETPNLDKLAAGGTVFSHCFIQGGFHGAICVASRATVVTGRHLWDCGNGGNCLDKNKRLYPLWSETLGSAGYDTFVTGKWHINKEALTKGFQTIGPMMDGGMLISTDSKGQAYHRPAPGNRWTPYDPEWQGQWMNVDGKIVHSSVRWADAAIDYLENHASKNDKPFFMHVAFNAPHDPRQSPKEYVDKYPPDKMPNWKNFVPKHPFDLFDFKTRDELLAPYPRTPEAIHVHLQEYFGIITHLDSQIGRIIDALNKSGKAENTIIVFASDNGLAIGQHGLLGKQSMYEHSIRVPLILSGPGIPKGRRIDAMVYLPSLFATTCELAGVDIPSSVEFPSFVPLMTGQKKKLHETIYAALEDKQRMIRTETWKLIRYPQARKVQLFDMRNDPWEIRNLAEDPKYSDILIEMNDAMKKAMKEMNDPMPSDAVFFSGTVKAD